MNILNPVPRNPSLTIVINGIRALNSNKQKNVMYFLEICSFYRHYWLLCLLLVHKEDLQRREGRLKDSKN